MTGAIAYLVHDVGDAAVARRAATLRAGGASVRIGGFRRQGAASSEAGVAVLATTHDARMGQRVGAVALALLRRQRALSVTAGADTILARNLEALAVAASVRRPGQRLVYECLDLHRLLTGRGAAAHAVRAVERRLLRGVDRVIVSAPGFAAHFRGAGYRGPIALVENRLWGPPSPQPPRPKGPPWRIAWLGMLRCRWSLQALTTIAEAAAGAIEVIVAGRVATAAIPDFALLANRSPYLRYVGAYAPADLPHLYGEAHFAWAVDRYEAGGNSAMLLPNRLYEGLAYGAVPIADRGNAIAAWLAGAGVGLVCDDLVAALPRWLTASGFDYAPLAAAVAALPPERVRMPPAEARALVADLLG